MTVRCQRARRWAGRGKAALARRATALQAHSRSTTTAQWDQTAALAAARMMVLHSMPKRGPTPEAPLTTSVAGRVPANRPPCPLTPETRASPASPPPKAVVRTSRATCKPTPTSPRGRNSPSARRLRTGKAGPSTAPRRRRPIIIRRSDRTRGARSIRLRPIPTPSPTT